MNSKTDPYALRAWCWQALADELRLETFYEPDSVTSGFLREISGLSARQHGLLLARDLLRQKGIPLVNLRPLPRMHLDGAAIWAADRRPVVALTLRYDRKDNFWLCLLRELAHVGLQMAGGKGVFIDDLTLRPGPGEGSDPGEAHADALAEGALIPQDAWEDSEARRNPTTILALNFAQSIGVHPAVVASRVRYERGNCRLLSQLVDGGQVRPLFDEGGH